MLYNSKKANKIEYSKALRQYDLNIESIISVGITTKISKF